MNIGILVSKNGLSDFEQKVLKPILEDSRFNIKVASIDNRKTLTIKQKIFKNLKRGRGGYIVIMAIQKFFSVFVKDNSKNVSTKDYCYRNQIDIIETSSLYSPEVLNTLKSYNLDILLLINGYGIIKEPLINLTKLGILSYHHGNMRKYRGMPPAFWELYHNEKEVGMTVQKLSIGLDSGLPIIEKSVKIECNDTLKSLEKRVIEESTLMMHKGLVKLLNPKFKGVEISEFGEIYTLPNLREWIIFSLKILTRKIYCR